MLIVDDEAVRIMRASGLDAQGFTRAVHDGTLTALRCLEPAGWHLSVSHAARRAHGVPRAASRYPTWDELAHARYELLPDDIDVVMHLPPPAEFLSVHEHLLPLPRAPAPMTAYRLTVERDLPACDATKIARAALCRTVHALDGHGQLVLVQEDSMPHLIAFTLCCRLTCSTGSVT